MEKATKTLAEVAALLGFSYSFLYRQIRGNKIPYHKLGALYFFTQEDIAKILEKSAQGVA